MVECIKQFIGKNCMIYTMQFFGGGTPGIIKEVTDNAIVLETKHSTDIINLDYVIRVSEIVKRK